MRAMNAGSSNINPHVRPPYHSDMEKFRNPDQEYKGPTMMDQGTDYNRIEGYLEAVIKLTTWAIKNGFRDIVAG
jgi:hypothetical protein